MSDELGIQDDISLEDWLDIFKDEVRKRGYHGPIDDNGVEGYYDEGKTPELAAELFVGEMS